MSGILLFVLSGWFVVNVYMSGFFYSSLFGVLICWYCLLNMMLSWLSICLCSSDVVILIFSLIDVCGWWLWNVCNMCGSYVLVKFFDVFICNGLCVGVLCSCVCIFCFMLMMLCV